MHRIPKVRYVRLMAVTLNFVIFLTIALLFTKQRASATTSWEDSATFLRRYAISYDPNHVVNLHFPTETYAPEIPEDDWRHRKWCDVRCVTGRPCQYKDEVDLRIILLTTQRPKSLLKTLDHVDNIRMGNDRMSVDVWVDKRSDGEVHLDTLLTLANYSSRFKNGRFCVHVQSHHAYIATQWVDTYRPRKDTKEVAIILEDDIDLSPHVWKWYKALHAHFRYNPEIAGYSLKMQELRVRAVNKLDVFLKGPWNHTIFLYACFQTFGFSPAPEIWREFQDWYHEVRKDKNANDKKSKVDTLVPEVADSLHYHWWNKFRAQNFQESMAHEMFFVYYMNVVRTNLYTVYSNLLEYGKIYHEKDTFLCIHRAENGLHFKAAKVGLNDGRLLHQWSDRYTEFPEKPRKMNLAGNIVGENHTEVLAGGTIY